MNKPMFFAVGTPWWNYQLNNITKQTQDNIRANIAGKVSIERIFFIKSTE
jgi:hypothetical protein